MGPTFSGERRACYRLRYPEAAAPKLLLENRAHRIVELSETGVRIECGRGPFADGTGVAGWVRFQDGFSAEVEGQVLRTEGSETIIHFSKGVSFRRMLDEQRKLIRRYPVRFDRAPASAGI